MNEIEGLLKRRNEIWNKIRKSVQKNLVVNQSVIKKIKWKRKLESYKDKIKTDFGDKEIPYKGFQYICL